MPESRSLHFTYLIQWWQNGYHFTDDILKCASMNGNFCISVWIWLKFVPKGPNWQKSINGLTHHPLVIPYGDRDLSEHWLRQWLIAWWHQAITRTNDFWLVRFCEINPRAMSQHVSKLLFCIMILKIVLLTLLPHTPGANDFMARHLFIQTDHDQAAHMHQWTKKS